jgi:3-dehydroquinate synthetase
MPGSGKTRVGRIIARRLGRPFVDTDEQIAHATGRSPAQLIREDGVASFRRLEADAVSQACAVDGAVIAVGGGSVLDPLNRWALLEHGMRLGLDADVATLASRVEADGVDRPLLGDDLVAGLSRTARERQPVYRAVDATVDASADPEVVAEAALAALKTGFVGRWRPLFEASFDRHDPREPEQGRLTMGRGITREALDSVRGNPATLADARAIDSSPTLVASLPSDRLCVMQGGEDAKSMARLDQVLSWLGAIGAERTDPLIVAGGGTLGDVGGLAAALHKRGMPLVHVPTTWLAQADSSIGGKAAIDMPGAKNAVGTFWPPVLVVSDFDLLDSLPIDRRRDGLAECLKAGLNGDPVLWDLVEVRGRAALAGDDPAAAYAITERAVRLKLDIVDRDPYEQGERRVLNLGHTLGHALEVESDYMLAHGAAVALGLRAVAAIAKGRGAEPTLPARLDAVLSNLGFESRRSFDRNAVRGALAHDKKKTGGRQRWILPMDLGRVVEVDDVTDSEVDVALSSITA